jgi:hypothetical protein
MASGISNEEAIVACVGAGVSGMSQRAPWSYGYDIVTPGLRDIICERRKVFDVYFFYIKHYM